MRARQPPGPLADGRIFREMFQTMEGIQPTIILSMTSDPAFLPSAEDFAEELSFRLFRPSLLDELSDALTPLFRTPPVQATTLRIRLAHLTFYIAGMELVRCLGQTKFTLEAFDRVRHRLSGAARSDAAEALDGSLRRFAQGVRARGNRHRTVALAEAFAVISGEADNTPLKLALMKIVDRMGQEVRQTIEEIAEKPNPFKDRPLAAPSFRAKDVEDLKQEFRTSGREWFRRLQAELRHPASQMMISNLPDGPTLWNHARLMGGFAAGSLFCSALLLLTGQWLWSLAAIGIWYFVFDRAQTDAVYEVAARLLILNKQLRRPDRLSLIGRE